MAIKIRTSNALVEVDSINEFRLVMEVMQSMNGHETQPVRIEKKPEQGHSLKTFFRKLSSPKQIETLKLLRQRIEGMTDSELRQSLGFKNNNELAGVMGGIARNAKKHGFNYADIIAKEDRIDNAGKRSYSYRLTEAMKEIVPGALM